MGNRKYTLQQQMKLARLEAVHAEYVLAKANMRAEIEAAYRNKLQDYEYQESRLMNEAKQQKVTGTDIGRAVGTANWTLLRDKYALTAHEFEAVNAELDKYEKWLGPRWEIKKYSQEGWMMDMKFFLDYINPEGGTEFTLPIHPKTVKGWSKFHPITEDQWNIDVTHFREWLTGIPNHESIWEDFTADVIAYGDKR